MPSPVDVSTPSDREIVVSRSFHAPAEMLFDFHTKPEYVQKWLLGPPGWSMPVCEIDLRVGGRFTYVWRNDQSGHQFGTRGEFREVSPPTRLVHTEMMDGAPGEALCTLTFTQSGDSTILTTRMLFSSKDARDQALESGMTGGMAQSYDRLEEFMHHSNGAVS